jgi:hypothetical protein
VRLAAFVAYIRAPCEPTSPPSLAVRRSRDVGIDFARLSTLMTVAAAG